MLFLKKINFSLFFMICFSHLSCNLAFAHAEYTIEAINLLEKESILSIAKSELRNKLINEELKESEIEKIILLADFDEDSAKALMAMSLDIEFDDIVKIKEDKEKNTSIYQIKAFIRNKAEIIPDMQENMAKNLLLYRLIQIEKDTEDLLKSIEESLTILNNSKNTEKENPILKLTEEKIQMLQALSYMFEELTNENSSEKTWENPDEVIALLEALVSYSKMPLSLLNSLAEVYLYSERPQKALQIIEEAHKKYKEVNLFTDYLNILTALMRKETALAEIDVKNAMAKLDANVLYTNFMRPYFLVLQGAVAQTKEDFPNMCKAYEEACFYNHCAPYFAVQDTCTAILQ